MIKERTVSSIFRRRACRPSSMPRTGRFLPGSRRKVDPGSPRRGAVAGLRSDHAGARGVWSLGIESRTVKDPCPRRINIQRRSAGRCVKTPSQNPLFMHRSHSKLQRYAQYVGSVPLRPQSEKHSGFRPVHVAAALTACEARFLAASAGNTNHAVSIPVMARVTIRMISSQFQCYPSQHPRGAYASAGSSLVRLTLCNSSSMQRSSSVSDAEPGSELA
jgi:hypothetical protein